MRCASERNVILVDVAVDVWPGASILTHELLELRLVVAADDVLQVTVMAFPAEATALEFVLPMLQSGRIAEAVLYLESLTHSAPANAEVLYNLGISYNEPSQYGEATTSDLPVAINHILCAEH